VQAEGDFDDIAMLLSVWQLSHMTAVSRYKQHFQKKGKNLMSGNCYFGHLLMKLQLVPS
jgi:hypothetical protein